MNFKEIMGDWCHPLNSLLTSNYMSKLLIFLEESYNLKDIRPHKKNVFKPFRETKFSDLKVVIIGDEPYHSFKSTGIAYANPESILDLEGSLAKIEKCIERTCYDDFKLHMHTDLLHWCHQGVLPIYSSLTVETAKKGSHHIYWKNFIRELIKSINSDKTGIIFMLWGEKARSFKHLIGKNHYIMEFHDPMWAVQRGLDWNCPHFKHANGIIKNNNGEEFCIKW